jgi:hypothetical protein
MRIETESRGFTDAERAYTRLSHEFRSDVHRATSAELNVSRLKEGVFLGLQLPENQTAEYGRESGRVLRTIFAGGKVTARDEFTIPPAAMVTVKQIESPVRIILLISPLSIDAVTDNDAKLKSYRAIPGGTQIEATLNRPSSTTAQTRGEQSP